MPDLGPGDLERFRPYLVLLARLGLDRRLRGKLDSSDVGQQTLAQAVEKWGQFEGRTEAELRGWLRAILASVLRDQTRKFMTGEKRALGREKSLEQNLEDTSARLDQWLKADESSPSDQAVRQERILQLTEALGDIPEDQRIAVELHYLQEWTIREVAEDMQLPEATVARLLRLGLKALRQFFSGLDP